MISNEWRPRPTITDAVPAKPHLLLRATSIVSVLVGLLCTVPAVYYTYLNINPPEPRAGDLYFGDGTGFVLGAVTGGPAVAALTAGILIPILWRRGLTTGAIVVAGLASVPCSFGLLLAGAFVEL